MRHTPWRTSATACFLAALLSGTTLVTLRARADDDDDAKARITVSSDFNRDGLPDLAEATPGVLSISLGHASGATAHAPIRLPIGPKPTTIVAGDFNQDGLPDLIVGDDDGSVTLFLGDGTGKLTPSGEIAHLGSVVSVVAADFNHDGLPDLAISDQLASSVTVLLGTGNGTFEREWSFPLRMAGTHPHLSSADFDGDRNSDLAVVYDGDQDTYDVMLGDGKGHFVKSTALSRVLDPNAYCTP